MSAPLWDPDKLRAVRRINRRTLAAGTGLLLLAGLAALAGSTGIAGSLLVASLLASVIGSLAAISATGVGRCLL